MQEFERDEQDLQRLLHFVQVVDSNAKPVMQSEQGTSQVEQPSIQSGTQSPLMKLYPDMQLVHLLCNPSHSAQG